MRIPLILAAAASLSFSSLAMADGHDQIQPWKEQTGTTWGIFTDPTIDGGCLMQSVFTDGTTIRIGYDPRDSMPYMAAFNSGWGEVRVGEKFGISYDLDGDAYSADVSIVSLDDTPGALIPFDNPDFLESIAERQTMTIFRDGAEVLAFDLTGTKVSIAVLRKCHNEFLETSG